MQGLVTAVNRERGVIAVRAEQGTKLTVLEHCDGIDKGDVLEWHSTKTGPQTYQNKTKGKPVNVVVRKHDAFKEDLL